MKIEHFTNFPNDDLNIILKLISLEIREHSRTFEFCQLSMKLSFKSTFQFRDKNLVIFKLKITKLALLVRPINQLRFFNIAN